MLAGIITENVHEYDTRLNLFGKRIRIIPNMGYLPVDNGVKIILKVYAQEIDENGNEKLIEMPKENNEQFYTDDEINAMFSSFNITITPTDLYMKEFREMMQTVLLADTMAKGYFGGDNCVPYVPVENN